MILSSVSLTSELISFIMLLSSSDSSAVGVTGGSRWLSWFVFFQMSIASVVWAYLAGRSLSC
ncbi:hypothetical protein D3C73_1423050 [compost metagenome]